MILSICVDNRMGMTFNGRRQSQDSILRERIVQLSSKSKLWMSHYSKSQFKDIPASNINISDNLIIDAEKTDFCFIENENTKGLEEYAEMIILYKWNRAYPYDKKLDIDLTKWKCVQITEFAGSSHSKITEEVYLRNEK